MIYSHLLKLNTFILIRVIKEMMTMQHAKENQSEQIRWDFCVTSPKSRSSRRIGRMCLHHCCLQFRSCNDWFEGTKWASHCMRVCANKTIVTSKMNHQQGCKHVRHIRQRLDENSKHVDLLSFTSCIPTSKFMRVNIPLRKIFALG